MFDISLDFDDICISSMERKDIDIVKAWLEVQRCNGSSKENYLNIDEFDERFLESYVSESEFFTKISFHNMLIGIIKGRIEFTHKNEVWIWCYVIDDNVKDEELESIILDRLTDYFVKEFGINNFYTVVARDSNQIKKFWRDNGFKLLRISENYYDNNGQKADMLIMKKER